VKAYLGEVTRRFGTARLTHATLSGFYWLNETIGSVDTSFIPRLADAIHRAGLRFYWIPYYGASGAERWQGLGFDEAWQQPNYFFHPEVPGTRLDTAIARARKTGMGLELEFNPKLFQGWPFADRLLPYLSALETAPDLRQHSITIYEGAGALIQLARSRDAWHRALYNRLVAALMPPQPPPGR